MRERSVQRRAEASSARRVRLAAVARGEACPLCYRLRDDAALTSGWVVCGHDFHLRAQANT
jgi:hypothetical protein